MVKKLLPYIPEHTTYVEPFGGGASLLFAKEPSKVEVYNDLNSDLVNFFRVLRNRDQFHRLWEKCCLTPYSREEYYFCRETWQDCTDPIERAYRWYVIARMSFAGIFLNSWGFVISTSTRGMASSVNSWQQVLLRLPRTSQRLFRVQVENQPAMKIIQAYDTPDTFFYLDPPYVHDTRKSTRYQHEMTDVQHEELVDVLLDIKGKVLLSGYPHPIYERLEKAGWHRKDFSTFCISSNRKNMDTEALKNFARVETIWWNYQKPLVPYKNIDVPWW